MPEKATAKTTTAKKAAPRTKKKDPEAAVLEAIAEMPDWERTIGERLHEIILESGPELSPRLWYSQPAYATAGKVICFFRGAEKDGERYVTFGFSGEAALDEGSMWPTAYALTGLTETDEKTIGALVEKAAG